MHVEVQRQHPLHVKLDAWAISLFQGYAMLEQIVSGIHTRLYARAYIVADPSQDR